VPSLRAHRSAITLAAAGFAVALAGCAAVPTSGSVHVGRALPAGGGLEPNDIAHVVASAPVSGMSPKRIVTGFLNSLVDSDGNYAIARLYLAPGAVWHTASGTTLYESTTTVRVGPRTVDVAVARVGTVDARGNYRVAPGTLHARFTVARSDGQWRISHLPPGILLSTSDADRTLQPAVIYFFNRAETRLVPDPVLVPPDEPGLATTLVHELVDDGPSRELAPAVYTAVPHGTGLVGTVPIDGNGVADVDLAGSVQQVTTGQLQRLSAQIVWTLRQLPSVTAVRLLVNGGPLSVSGAALVQPIGSWPEFDPEAPPTSHGALLSDQGLVAGLSTAVPAALISRGLEAPAVSADGVTVAALRTTGKRATLLVGPSSGPLRPRLRAAAISGPVFDPDGDVLVVKGVGTAARIVEVTATGQVRRVLTPRSVRTAGISEVSVSRDGSRIAMDVGAPGRQALLVGALTLAHGVLAIRAPNVVIPSSARVSGVAWAGASEVVTTVQESADRRAVLETDVDGYEPHTVSTAGLPKDPTQVAAAPGQPVLAGAAGAVWMLSGARWQRVSPGGDPSYAG
jgi:hypothetical protein